MMFRIRLALMGFALLLAPSARPEGWSPVIDEFRRSDFQADGLGWSAAQLEDGRLVFGFDALVSFDGLAWRQHPIAGTYALRALAAAPEGGLWVGGVNEVGVLAESHGQLTYRSLTGHLPADLRGRLGDVWYAFADGPGRAVFVTTEHVLLWSGGSFTVHHLPARPRLAAFRLDGRIHIARRGENLLALTADGGLEPVLSAATLGSSSVVWMGKLGESLVAATTNGLRRVAAGRLEPISPELDAWIREGVLTCATALSDGRLALGTLRNGARIIEPPGPDSRHFELTTGLPAEYVTALFQDREGWLWVVSPARLRRIWPRRDVSIFQPPQPEAFPAYALAPHGEAALVATDSGLWRTAIVGEPPLGRLAPVRGTNDRMLSLLPLGPQVMVGHRSGLAIVGTDGEAQPARAFDADVFALAADPVGNLYVAHGRRVSRLTGTGTEPVAAHLPDVPTSLAAPAAGELFAATWMQGIVPLGADSPAARRLAAAVAADTGASFVAAAAGTTFAARGRTVAALGKDGRLRRAPPLPEGFEPRALHARTEQEAWLAGERRFADGSRAELLLRVDAGSGPLVATPVRLDVLSRAGSLRSLTTDRDDPQAVLWIGGDAAVLRVDRSALQPGQPPAAPRFHLVAATLTPGHTALLPHRNNRLELEITSPEPGRCASLRLETLLVGGESRWSEPRDQRSVSLANLQSGRYVLRARYVTPGGLRSEVAEFAFAVAPPWWLTPWVLVLEVLGAALSVLAIVRIRVRSLRRKAAHLEKLVAERTAELVHASQAKTEFVSSMSHELRNPLNGIVATAHAIESAGLSDDQKGLLVTLRHCAGLLDALIGDVLDFAEIESGRIALKSTEFDPVDLVRAAVGVIQPVAQRKGIAVRIELDPDLPRHAVGDSSRLQQVLLNLLSNAVKFSDRGEVVVRGSRLFVGDEERLQVSVRDQGPGIPPGERAALFEKFSRTSYARDRGIAGTGLGLAVCRQLMERMGGRIWLEESDAPGATFTFQVPLRRDAPAPAEAPVVGAAPLPRTALVVEDLEYNARAMLAMLAALGCRAEAVATASAALQRVKDKRFDVIFIDCQLPDMTGPQLAAAITAIQGESPDAPPLIATTACADEATRDACRRGGMDGFITKPITPEKIRTALAGGDHARLPASPMILPPVAPGPSTRLDLRQLRIIAQDPASLQEQAKRMGVLLQTDLQELCQSARRQDLGAMRSSSHRIVSHARFLGANMLAAIADEIQQTDDGSVDLAVNLVEAVEREVDRVLKELAAATVPRT